MPQTVTEVSERLDKLADRVNTMDTAIAEQRGSARTAKWAFGLAVGAIVAVAGAILAGAGYGVWMFFEMRKDVAVHAERFDSVKGDIAQLRMDVNRLTDFVLKGRVHMATYMEATIVKATDTEIMVDVDEPKERKTLKLSADVWVINGTKKIKPTDLEEGTLVKIEQNDKGEVELIEVTRDVSKLLAPSKNDDFKLPVPPAALKKMKKTEPD